MSDIDDQRLSALYRRAADAEPSAKLDDAVRAMAHAAFAPKRPAYARWALAATVVLGAGISWQLMQYPPSAPRDAERPAVPSAPLVEEAAMDNKAMKRAPSAVPADATMGSSGASFAPSPIAAPTRERAPSLPKQTWPPPNATDSLRAPASMALPRRESVDDASMDRAKIQDDARCRALWPAATNDAAAWQAVIARLRADGDVSNARCVQRRYQQLFDQRVPTTSKPALDR